jgi:hypothetical protein
MKKILYVDPGAICDGDGTIYSFEVNEEKEEVVEGKDFNFDFDNAKKIDVSIDIEEVTSEAESIEEASFSIMQAIVDLHPDYDFYYEQEVNQLVSKEYYND